MAPDTQIGKVTALSGQATVRSVQGEVRALVKDAPVFLDDTIITESDSNVELAFLDGTIFAQGENSEMLLDVYVYDPEGGQGELLFNLAEGSLRAVSGEIVNMNPEGFNVETPLSTVGIRGTTFFVLLTPEGQVAGVEEMDPAHVVLIQTDVGQMTIAQSGDFVAVQLDGFLSDPTMFTPQFLEGVRDLAPMQSEDREGTQLPDPQDEDGGEDTPQDIPQEVLDDLATALQQLQGIQDSQDLLNAAATAAQATEDGVTDTLEELQEVLENLEQAVETVTNAITSLADDVLFGNAAAVVAALDLKSLGVDIDGTDYETTLQNQGYSIVMGTNIANTSLDGSANQDAIFGLAGGDSITGQQNNDIIFGGSGTDNISGGAGNDIIYGGTDGDTIIGQGGSDYLIGGSGADNFKYEALTDFSDTIRDFSHTDGDKIGFSNAITGGNFGAKVFDTWDFDQNDLFGYSTAIYIKSTGKVYFDADGSNTTTTTPVFVCDLTGSPQDVLDSNFEQY